MDFFTRMKEKIDFVPFNESIDGMFNTVVSVVQEVKVFVEENVGVGAQPSNASLGENSEAYLDAISLEKMIHETMNIGISNSNDNDYEDIFGIYGNAINAPTEIESNPYILPLKKNTESGFNCLHDDFVCTSSFSDTDSSYDTSSDDISIEEIILDHVIEDQIYYSCNYDSDEYMNFYNSEEKHKTYKCKSGPSSNPKSTVSSNNTNKPVNNKANRKYRKHYILEEDFSRSIFGENFDLDLLDVCYTGHYINFDKPARDLNFLELLYRKSQHEKAEKIISTSFNKQTGINIVEGVSDTFSIFKTNFDKHWEDTIKVYNETDINGKVASVFDALTYYPNQLEMTVEEKNFVMEHRIAPIFGNSQRIANPNHDYNTRVRYANKIQNEIEYGSLITKPQFDENGILENDNLFEQIHEKDKTKKFYKLNKNGNSINLYGEVGNFCYLDKNYHKTPLDARYLGTYSYDFLKDIFRGEIFKTEIVFLRCIQNINNDTDVRGDLNCVGKVKHWNNRINIYSVTEYRVVLRDNTRTNNFLNNTFLKTPMISEYLYSINRFYDVVENEKLLYVPEELLKNCVSSKTINPNNSPSVVRQSLTIAINNNTTTNISRNAIIDGRYLYNDTIDFAMHLYWYKLFYDSIFFKDESHFRI